MQNNIPPELREKFDLIGSEHIGFFEDLQPEYKEQYYAVMFDTYTLGKNEGKEENASKMKIIEPKELQQRKTAESFLIQNDFTHFDEANGCSAITIDNAISALVEYWQCLDTKAWINVSQSLPEINIRYSKTVLVLTYNLNQPISHLAYYDKFNESFIKECDHGCFKLANVTHWRKLPTPPTL